MLFGGLCTWLQLAILSLSTTLINISKQTTCNCILYVSLNPTDVCNLSSICASDVSRWFIENALLLNPTKTEAVIFTVRRYVIAVYAVVVCPSVRTSQAGTVPKRPNIGSRKQCHNYDSSPGTLVFWSKNLGEIATASPPTGRQVEVGCVQSHVTSLN